MKYFTFCEMFLGQWKLEHLTLTTIGHWSNFQIIQVLIMQYYFSFDCGTSDRAYNHFETLYFVSPRARPWRQRVVQNNTLVIARVTSVFSHTFKKESRDWRTNDAFGSVYPSTRWVTSWSFTRWDKVLHQSSWETYLGLSICLQTYQINNQTV